jgi:hypothetical protein
MKACWNCGQQLPDHAIFCSACGANTYFRAPDGSPVQGPGGTPPVSPFAFASVACGVIAWVIWLLAGALSAAHVYALLPNLLGPAMMTTLGAIVLGHLARHRAKKKRGAERGRGRALAGLLLGYTGLLVPTPLLIALVLIPNLDKLGGKSLVTTGEASVVGSLKTLNIAQQAYASAYEGSFGPSLAALGPGPNEKIDASHAGLISSELAAGKLAAYRLRYRPGRADPQHSNAITHYELVAEPEEAGSGRPSYYTDESGVIRRSTSGPANRDSPPVE